VEKTRLVELSLFYAVQKALAIRKTNEIPSSSDYKNYSLKYKNISSFFSPIVEVNAMTVSVGYAINYIQGIVIFDNALLSSDTVKVTYEYNKVNIYDEGKNPLDDDFRYPALAIYEVEMRDEGFELGNSVKEKNGIWSFEVLAEKGGERHDISDKIYRAISEEGSIPIVDYNIAFPINADGMKNVQFNEEIQTIGHITCDSINKRNAGSLGIGDKPKYISEIMAELSYI
jgi:hypothetical protein